MSSGMRMATHTVRPSCFLAAGFRVDFTESGTQAPIISMIHASLGSQMVNVSPSEQ